ncbi:MAG: hypothetical protein JSS63_04610 [Bacteroidetes bacterium]|nr:hypothetical protein [Bacteroidota bacterium]
MIISEKTRDLIFEIREYSGNSLSDFNDISILLESAFYDGNKEKFLDIIFKAKFLSGMLGIFANESVEQSSKEKISDEFKEQFIGFIDEFKALSEKLNAKTREFFEKKYFQLTPVSLENNIRFIKDLTICKNFFLDNPEHLKN